MWGAPLLQPSLYLQAVNYRSKETLLKNVIKAVNYGTLQIKK